MIGAFTGIPEILIDAPGATEGQLFSVTPFLSGFHQTARAVGEWSTESVQRTARQ